jgi:regulator of protease activity HflC (stomatin/prohibitin superfamily)
MASGLLFLGFAVILLLALMMVLSAVKIVRGYERGVVFRLGRLAGVRGPGLVVPK